MDRLHINSFTPAEIAERVADQPGPRVSSSDRQYAREELIGRLMDGNRVDGMDMAGLVDCAYNDDWKHVCAKVAGFLITAESGNSYERQDLPYLLGLWARELAEKWIDSRPDLIEDKAAEIAAWDE